MEAALEMQLPCPEVPQMVETRSRPHRGGEPRYLTNPMRPLWSFSQLPNPEYFTLQGALFGTGDGLEKGMVTREALSGLLNAAGLSPEDADSPMEVFMIAGGDTVPYPVLYRHLLLREQVRTLDILRRMPLVARQVTAIKRLFLRNGDALREDELTWPPRSAKHSVEQAIDVAALNALVRGNSLPGAASDEIPAGSGPGEADDGPGAPVGRSPEPARSLGLTVRNDIGELERVAAAVEEFAAGHRFQVQLCLEEVLAYIVEHGYDNAAAHGIEIGLEMKKEERVLAIRVVDDGREPDPGSFMFRPGPDTIDEERVLDGLGQHLAQSCVDDLKYRREGERNHLTQSKRIGK